MCEVWCVKIAMLLGGERDNGRERRHTRNDRNAKAMALSTFLNRCKATYSESCRLFLTDNVSSDVLRPVLIR